MGFKFSRAKNWVKDHRREISAVYTGGASASPVVSRHSQEQLGFAAEGLPAEPYTSGSPYAPGAEGAWDSSGMPTGPMPRGQYALDWQYEANRRAEQRRTALWGDAQNIMRQGTDLLQSYRPGGSAALASGMYGQRASLYGSQAMNVEAPDLLMAYRERKQDEAEAERKQAERFARTMNIASLGISAMGAFSGGSAANAAMAGAAAGAGTEALMGGEGGSDAGMIGPQAAGAGGSISMPGMQGQQGIQVGQGYLSPGQQGPLTPGQQARQNVVGAPAQGGGATGQLQMAPGGGGAGAAGGGAGGPSKAGGQGPRAQGAQGGAQGGMQGGMQGGGAGGLYDSPGPLSTFQAGEAAAMSMASSPVAQSTVYPAWYEDPARQSSVALQMRGARERLLMALQS